MFDPVTFTKNGATKVAETPRQAVQLRFDGWREAAADSGEPVPVPTPDEPVGSLESAATERPDPVNPPRATTATERPESA